MGNVARAEIRLVDGVHYARDDFAEGLERLGFQTMWRGSFDPSPGDVLVIWNRYYRDEARARHFERNGGTVIVTENAWLGPEEKDQHHFALCRGHHNGAGSWEVGDYDRWPKLGIELAPWRSDGKHILLLPQRGLGEEGVAMPRHWPMRIIDRLRSVTNRPVKWNQHPGQRPHPPIDFADAWAVVTWGSGAALKAIIAGVPAFYDMPNWIGASAAIKGVDHIEAPYLGDRMPMLRKLSWAMWDRNEIASGEPFKWLLSPSSFLANSAHV